MPKNRKPAYKRGAIQKLFSIDWDDTNKKLILTSCEELNDTSWGAWFGEIQNILKSGYYQKRIFNQCHVDLSYCSWADPLPLLSLALSLSEYEETGGKVSMAFPAIPSNKNIENAKDFLSQFSKKKKYSNFDQRVEELYSQSDEQRNKLYEELNKESEYSIADLKDALQNLSKYRLIINQARFLKFLYREGFLNLFTQGNVITPCSKNEQPLPRECKTGDIQLTALTPSLNELPVSLAFERSTCLIATIIKLSTEDIADTFQKIDKWIEQELHKNISQVVYEEVPSWAQGDLQYRLVILLRETLHNIAEHAYKDKKFGLAAVYIRYREGALGEDSTTWKQLKKFSKRETGHKKTPLLQSNKLDSFSNTRSGFFEVFILDSGQGLFNSLGKASTEDKLNNLHQSMLDVFFRNNTSKGKNRSTEHGGLYLLRELLKPHQDYFRVRDEDAWWGTQVHLFNEKTLLHGVTRHTYEKDFGKKKLKGLAWTVRISWLEAQDYSGQNQLWRRVENNDEQTPIRQLFKNNDELPFSYNRVIKDSRFSPSKVFSQFNAEEEKYATDFLFLPRPLLMKNVIQEKIGTFLSEFSNNEKINLIIGDVPSEEATTYLAAIVRANKFQETSLLNIVQITIVTRELRVCVLTRNSKGLFEINKSEVNEFFIENTSDINAINNITNYLRTLRKHDSQRIKEIVTKTSSNSNHADFIKEEVIWEEALVDKDGLIFKEPLIIDGYLDFPHSLTHPLCREIYALNLKRLTGLSILGCRLESLDSLVDSLVTHFNAQIHPRSSKKQSESSTIIIQIGSIKVTGYTEDSENQANNQVFHFFQHPSGNAAGAFLLPWIGDEEKITKIEDPKAHDNYRRVGKTPVISRGGWKSYEIPRYDQDKICIYEKNPKDSYRAWQEPSRSPMKLGHWVYGGHHEIFTINLLLAFKSEFDHIGSGNSLAKFTYANFFRILNIKTKDLNEQNKRLILNIKDAKFKHLLPDDLWIKKPILVYPSHPVTDHIINEFLSLLEGHALLRVRDNLISILPIRRHRSGSGLQVPGLTLERLNDAIKTVKNRPVVYFDDGVISGRTFIEVKRLLHGMGYGDIYSVVLLDRQRLPSVYHLKNDKHVGYWRLDAPSMGGKAHCPLCHAIDMVTTIEESIVSEIHKQRLMEWCDTWKELDPSTQWGNKGLRPIPLNLKKPNRRFCLRYDSGTEKYESLGKEDEQGILLTNSAGLIAWVTELHSVTSRDDFSLQLIEKESENLSGEVRIQLLASQLLLFTTEFDTTQAKKLAWGLIEELWHLQKDDRHSALACLVMISCLKEPFLLIKEFLDLDNRWETLKEQNMDFELLIASTFISSSLSPKQINEVEQNPYFANISRIFKLKYTEKAGIYYRLHRESIDALGKSHSSPLQRFIVLKEEHCLQLEERTLIDTLANASQISEIAKNIIDQHSNWLRADSEIFEGSHSIVEKIKINKNNLHGFISELINLINHKDENDYEKEMVDMIFSTFDKANNEGKKLLNEGKKLHDSLFSRLGVQEIRSKTILFPFFKEIKSFEKRFNLYDEQPIIKWHHLGKNETEELFLSLKKPDIEEAFVVWDEEIKEAVSDIFGNVNRITEKIINPWKPRANGKASLWCRIRLSELTVNIEMKNKTSHTAKTIENMTKNSHSHCIIREVGGNVSYSNQKDRLLLTVISLPYAHTLQIIPQG